MRVLQVRLDDDHLVDLHPAVSVLSGLADPRRAALRRAFDAIGAGLEPDVAVLLEAHGLLLDATQGDLDLLDVARHPAGTVVASPTVSASLPAEDAARLRTAERDVVLLASDRARAHDDLARAETAASRPTHDHLRARAAHLRAGMARHEATPAEPVRAALDDVRDRRRLGAPAGTAELAVALAAVGLQIEDLGLADDDVARIAEDWSEERRHEAAWAVGAGVELRAIEDVLSLPEAPADEASQDLDALRARASRAMGAHAEAVVRLDDVRTDLAARPGIHPTAQELAEALGERLSAHRPDRLAGAVPLLLDGVLARLDDVEVAGLLDHVAGRAGAVQVVVVDDHPAASAWARAAGIRRAATVEPMRSAAAAPPC